MARRRKYNEDFGSPRHRQEGSLPLPLPGAPPPGAIRIDDLDYDDFAAFSTRIRAIRWPTGFKPTGIEKYDGVSDAKLWIRTYSTAIRAAGGTIDTMAAYFPVMMGPAGQTWLTGLVLGSIDSWKDLCNRFIANF